MNLTLSADERTVRKARKAAESLGVSLNQAVRNFLEGLAGADTPDTFPSSLQALSWPS